MNRLTPQPFLTPLPASNAFCKHGPGAFKLKTVGALSHCKLAVKDLFQLQGEKNTAGNPCWFESHPPATKTASSLQKLLDAGAEFTGFTLTDELAYSLEGNNTHYGLIENPALAGHYCGGSSMGSAAVVAAQLADIGLATDTGGSVRVPASYCGLFGFRPSQYAVPTDGVIPLAPCFDTIGWFCNNATLLNTVGRLLLAHHQPSAGEPANRLIVIDDFMALADPASQAATNRALDKIRPFYTDVIHTSLDAPGLLADLAESFRILQARAIVDTHKDWLQTKPVFGDSVRKRIEIALAITNDEVKTAQQIQQRWCQLIESYLPDGSTLLIPTTPSTAPRIGHSDPTLRTRLLQLTAIAGLAGLPQCHLPLTKTLEEGLHKPSGCSLVMRKGRDRTLLSQVHTIHEGLPL